MVKEPKTIKVRPDSELATLLEEASETTLVLEKDGVRYRLEREDREERWAGKVGLAPVTMTVEETAGSVPALPVPQDFKEIERQAKEEHVERFQRKMQAT